MDNKRITPPQPKAELTNLGDDRRGSILFWAGVATLSLVAIFAVLIFGGTPCD